MRSRFNSYQGSGLHLKRVLGYLYRDSKHDGFLRVVIVLFISVWSISITGVLQWLQSLRWQVACAFGSPAKKLNPQSMNLKAESDGRKMIFQGRISAWTRFRGRNELTKEWSADSTDDSWGRSEPSRCHTSVPSILSKRANPLCLPRSKTSIICAANGTDWSALRRRVKWRGGPSETMPAQFSRMAVITSISGSFEPQYRHLCSTQQVYPRSCNKDVMAAVSTISSTETA